MTVMSELKLTHVDTVYFVLFNVNLLSESKWELSYFRDLYKPIVNLSKPIVGKQVTFLDITPSISCISPSSGSG